MTEALLKILRFLQEDCEKVRDNFSGKQVFALHDRYPSDSAFCFLAEIDKILLFKK